MELETGDILEGEAGAPEADQAIRPNSDTNPARAEQGARTNVGAASAEAPKPVAATPGTVETPSAMQGWPL